MKRWIGKWLVAVSVLHTLVAVVAYGRTYEAMATEGIWGAGLRSPGNSAASWFLLFGLLTLIAGVAISAQERAGLTPPRSIGLGLFVLAVLGIVLMPVSGFWLVIPPSLALLWPVRRPAVPGAHA